MTFQGNRDRIREYFSDVHVYMPYTVLLCKRQSTGAADEGTTDQFDP